MPGEIDVGRDGFDEVLVELPGVGLVTARLLGAVTFDRWRKGPVVLYRAAGPVPDHVRDAVAETVRRAGAR